MTKKFKDAVRQIHLWLGLATGLIVVIISLTGCVYVFEKEIRDFVQRDYNKVPVQNKGFIGLETIIHSFEKVAPGETLTAIRMKTSQTNATVTVTTKKKHVYFFNPYNGSLVKRSSLDWLDTAEHIHTSLLLEEPGKFIIRWSVAIFVIILISGIILWFPNQVRLIRQSITIKWGASFKRVNYDLHNVLGFYSSGVLLIIALSGLYFAFKEVKTAVSFVSGSKLSELTKGSTLQAPLSSDRALRYDQLYSRTAAQFPGADAMNMSVRKTGEIRLRLIYPGDWAKNQNTFFFDPVTGALINYKLYRNNTRADVMEATNYDLHTGQLFGLFGKIVAFIASLISASLPITGFIIWLKKQKKGKKKKKLVTQL
jgi:uncharacterized iron-regulated membrane protein